MREMPVAWVPLREFLMRGCTKGCSKSKFKNRLCSENYYLVKTLEQYDGK